jgi:beta-galactosidase
MSTPVQVVPRGLAIDGRTLLLHAASLHYWRIDRARWPDAIASVRALGFCMVDLYIPWSVHEGAGGRFDWGDDPRLDLPAFLRLLQGAGLFAIARPGPHINAELTGFGIPDRVLWTPECQARSPRGNPVILPMLPTAFPVPSYASSAFHREVAAYFKALGPVLAPHLHPHGPVVMLQVDNEGALYFRDSAYEQDYHPDAVALYRSFLQERYRDDENLRNTYGSDTAPLAQILPPTRFDASHVDQLARHLDWVEFHEVLLAQAMKRFRAAMEEAGLRGVPFSHNLPPGQDATPLNPALLGSSVDLVGFDFYHKADPAQRRIVARRTTELVARCEGLGVPAYAAELGAGFPPFFPPLDERDSEFTLLSTLAYGLRGFNLYMAVARDRWVGGPIDAQGNRRPSALFYERLLAALERLQFASLRRATPVRLLIPRSLRRLTRAMHAFGPATGTFFSVFGAGARERCLEDALGLDGPVALEGEAFLHAFEESLEVRGVPFAFVGGEDADVALTGARWVIVACSGGLEPRLLTPLRRVIEAGGRVTLGPRRPVRDGSLRLLPAPLDLEAIQLLDAPLAPSRVDALVARAIDDLQLPCFACDPDSLVACLHEDPQGLPRALFVLNPTSADVVGRVSVPGITRALDALDEQTFRADQGVLELRVPARSGRLLALS